MIISGFAYWQTNQLPNKAYQYIQQINFNLYEHRGVIVTKPGETTTTLEDKIADMDAYFDKGERLVALGGYHELLKDDPDNLELLLRIGLIELQESNYVVAEGYLKDAYKQNDAAFSLDAAWGLALLNILKSGPNLNEAQDLMEEVVAKRGNYFKEAGTLLEVME